MSVKSDIVIRPCKAWKEFQACAALREEVWGKDDNRQIPASIFLVASKIGGQVIGAFEAETLVGFALSFLGYRNRQIYLHSHLVAVRSSYRDRGIGREIKLMQREDAIRRRIDLIEWTFDPLQIRNARLNISRLGGIIRHYSPNLYGDSISPLDGGLPTDRVTVEWWIRSARVRTVLKTGQLPLGKVIEEVTVPGEIDVWKKSPETLGRAVAAQRQNRALLITAFERGLTILGFSVTPSGSGTFLLGKWKRSSRKSSLINKDSKER